MPAGRLYVVATPIGNLSDLSARGRAALEGADLILAEDTRVTRELLAAVGIGKKNVRRFDQHEERKNEAAGGFENVRERLNLGETIALVSDAGTPGISDPGAHLVDALQREGYAITPVPGPSAVATFISAVGLLSPAFTFEGFLPREAKKKRERFARLNEAFLAATKKSRAATLWFESPERMAETLDVLRETIPAARLCLGKELTKKFERCFVGSIEIVYSAYEKLSPEERRGEWIILIEPEAEAMADDAEGEKKPEAAPNYLEALKCLKVAGVSASDAVRAVSQVFGAPKNEVYKEGIKIFS